MTKPMMKRRCSSDQLLRRLRSQTSTDEDQEIVLDYDA